MNSKRLKINGRNGSEIFLSISLVLYDTPKTQLKETLKTLSKALEVFPAQNLRLFLVDNSPQPRPIYKQITWQNIPTEILTGFGNLGFGKAHNLALTNHRLGRFHLILNPDISIQKEAIKNGINFLLKHPEIGICAPSILTQENQLTHLGQRYPDLLSLGLRGVAPNFLRKTFRKYLDFYEMAELLPALRSGKIVKDIPCLSGSFLLMRSEIFRQLKGFDPKFFLYFEDFDFSLRAQKLTRNALLPNMIIRHFGGNASRKGLKHLAYFIRSACQFYQKHGWHFLNSFPYF